MRVKRVKVKPAYAMFEPWLTKERVRAGFLRSFGREPAEAVRTGGCWSVGPLTTREYRAWKQR